MRSVVLRGGLAALLVLGALLLLPVGAEDPVEKPPVPCFPGARGFGSTTPAGRGGQVLKVVNLDDSGPGSLRAALAVSGPRIVVFEVGGTIVLKKSLHIEHPFVTLAGQTAPSPGITLQGAGLQITSHDVLVQHIRIRVGDLPGRGNPGNRDGLQIIGEDAWNVVADHLSVGWAVDENIGIWGGPHDITISNSIISEGLFRSIHPKGPHSMGMLIGDQVKNVAVLDNLFAHNFARNPRIKGGATAVVVNNLMYNGGKRFVAIGSSAGPNFVSLVGNRMIAGPDTAADAAGIDILSDVATGTRIYLQDNLVSWMGYRLKPHVVFRPPIWHASLAPSDSHLVEEQVLASAGARPADRDPVDVRVVWDVRRRSGRIIDSPSDVQGWARSPLSRRPFQVPEDPGGDDDGDGYTHIEDTLHRMAEVVENRR